MAEELNIQAKTKQGRYEELLSQIKGLVSGENDIIANLANICAALKYGLDFFWVGFYLVKDDQLVLGPFQGPIACTRINKGKGVCGVAWEKEEALLISNVDEFPGHIACSSQSKSEIALPIFKNGKVAMILDVDSDKLADFDEVDKVQLSKLVDLIEELI